jgi:hypothetical protein
LPFTFHPESVDYPPPRAVLQRCSARQISGPPDLGLPGHGKATA